MKLKIGASTLVIMICLASLSWGRVATAQNAAPEQKGKAAIYLWSKTDMTSVKDGELASVYREADESLMDQVKDGLTSRGFKVTVVHSDKEIGADPLLFILLVRVDKVELGGKRPFGRTGKVNVVYTVQNKDRFDLIKRSHEETSVQKWQNCVKKISDQLVADVSNDVAKLSVPLKAEDKQEKAKQAPTGSAAEARLQELDNLKAKGLITEKEYEAKRKEILKGL